MLLGGEPLLTLVEVGGTIGSVASTCCNLRLAS